MGCDRGLNEMVDVNSSAQILAHCWYLIMRNGYYYNFMITECYLSLEHPPLSCRTRVLQDPTWVMLTSSNFPILQKEKLRPRESCSLRDSYFEKRCVWFSLFPCHSFPRPLRTTAGHRSGLKSCAFMGNRNTQQQ